MRASLGTRLWSGGLVLACALALRAPAAAQMDFRRGDVDGDGQTIAIVDSLRLINYLFVPGAQSLGCVAAADVNSDGSIGLSDAIALLNWGFQAGPEPAAPGPFVCGPDTSSLGCASYANCVGGSLPFGPNNILRVGSAADVIGSTVNVTVELDNPSTAIVGWSFGVCSDAALIAVASVDLGSTTTAVSPGFEQRAIYSDGWTAAVLIDAFGFATLPPGTGQEIYVANYDLFTVGTASLDFCETLGTPPVDVVFALPLGSGVSPATESGAIETQESSAPPPNDDCIAARSVTNGRTVFVVSLATTDGPDLAGFCDLSPSGDDVVHRDVWFCYRAGCTGPCTITAIGLGIDTRLAVYDGCSCPPAASSVIACNDDIAGAPPGPAQVSFNATANSYYLIQVGIPTEASPTGSGFLEIVGPCPTCIVPFPGANPVQLPPALCPYTSPNTLHLMIAGLPVGTTIEIAASHHGFFPVLPAPATGPLGGSGLTEEIFDSTIELAMTGTGLLAGFSRTIEVSFALCEVHTTPIDPLAPEQTIQADMRRMQGQLVGDPDFEYLTIMAGTDLGLPSLGLTTLTTQPNGDVVVDSAFHMNYQIGFVGAPGGALAGYSGTTTGIALMQTGNGVALPMLDGFLRGDANNDANFNIGDAIALLNHLFSMAAPPACRDAADANDDGGLDIGDAIFVLSRLFSGGPPPPLPGSVDCGPDPTPDALDCASSAACP